MLGDQLDIVVAPRRQQTPEVAYAPSSDRWAVTYAEWRQNERHWADVIGVFVEHDGTVHSRLPVLATPRGDESGWDVPGPITYDPASDRFFASSFEAGPSTPW